MRFGSKCSTFGSLPGSAPGSAAPPKLVVVFGIAVWAKAVETASVISNAKKREMGIGPLESDFDFGSHRLREACMFGRRKFCVNTGAPAPEHVRSDASERLRLAEKCLDHEGRSRTAPKFTKETNCVTIPCYAG